MDQFEANEAISGAKCPVSFGGKTYLCDQFEGPHMGTFSKWAKAQVKKQVKPVSAPLQEVVNDPGFAKLSPELQKLVVSRALDAAVVKKPTHEELAQDMQALVFTDEGFAFLVWLTARGNHANLQLSEVEAAVKASEAAPEYLVSLLAEAGVFPKKTEDTPKS